MKQIQSFLYLEEGGGGKPAWKLQVRKFYAETLEQQQIEVRQSVMDRLRQAREGQTKDFNTVCDRLEKKYTNAKV